MKTHEKLFKLDDEYRKARERILMNRDVTVEVIVKENKVKAKLLTAKDVIKSSTE